MTNNQKLNLLRFLYFLGIVILIVTLVMFWNIKWLRWSCLLAIVLYRLIEYPRAKVMV